MAQIIAHFELLRRRVAPIPRDRVGRTGTGTSISAGFVKGSAYHALVGAPPILEAALSRFLRPVWFLTLRGAADGAQRDGILENRVSCISCCKLLLQRRRRGGRDAVSRADLTVPVG
ncbi:hypothetical protein PFISCL1PPCAC_13707 [Pristionchus fissidentatus]|uniref:Ribosomal protein n=1 Tax=Pristionchus fissidentatus TaxID=1538716 RepID=A0AAV5VS09_9BILA|nr:hypothetical protein PFISCL1PPCAC_13707 [Pristionchus fissidentatus]